MAITLGDFNNRILDEIREFSNAGNIVPVARNLDYFLSVPRLINTHLTEMQTTAKIMQTKYDITHYMPDNQLGRVEWNEEDDAVHRDDDVTFEAQGSRAFSFQVGDTATIHLEEEINDVWTLIRTIEHVDTSGSGYVTYKGKTNISDVNNNFRIRFSGPYFYRFRWIGLFAENYASDDKVPSFEPYVPYTMPDNFYQLSKIVQTRPREINLEFGDFKFDVRNSNETTIYFDWYEQGEYAIHYFNYPDVVPSDAADDFILNIPEEMIPPLVFKIASKLQIDENTYISEGLYSEYVSSYNNMIDEKRKNRSFKRVQNKLGW